MWLFLGNYRVVGKKALKGKRIRADTLFISPVPNIRFLFFFKVAYYHHYRPSSYYHSFQAALFSSLFVDIGKEGFFSIGQRLSRDAAAKKLELIFRTLSQVSEDFALNEKIITDFENQRKCLIQHCKRSELRIHFEWTKVS